MEKHTEEYELVFKSGHRFNISIDYKPGDGLIFFYIGDYCHSSLTEGGDGLWGTRRCLRRCR